MSKPKKFLNIKKFLYKISIDIIITSRNNGLHTMNNSMYFATDFFCSHIHSLTRTKNTQNAWIIFLIFKITISHRKFFFISQNDDVPKKNQCEFAKRKIIHAFFSWIFTKKQNSYNVWIVYFFQSPKKKIISIIPTTMNFGKKKTNSNYNLSDINNKIKNSFLLKINRDWRIGAQIIKKI